MVEPGHIHFSSLDQMLISSAATRRLLMACAMGGIVGVEREWRHKDSGLRTNMLICMGACLFTIMSAVLAGDATPDKSRVASNIVQGIGFLGAGLIMHTKSRVFGLTSAATVFVVAAIGMTCGGGLYIEALIATVMLLVALQFVGALEHRLGWKRYPAMYEVRAAVGSAVSSEIVGAARAEALAEESGRARHRMFTAILHSLDAAGVRLVLREHENLAGMERVSFAVLATQGVHEKLLGELRASDATDQVVVFRDVEEE
jgi:putative Mg2+ transporter-C (MgtC) family protein